MPKSKKLFLAYASEDREIAKEVLYALRNHDYEVFFDESSLPSGQSYIKRIQNAIYASDGFIFLISPDSIRERKFTLTEIAIAEKKWTKASGNVLPVLIRKTPFNDIPQYLKGVSICEPKGNIAAEVVLDVDDMFSLSGHVRRVHVQTNNSVPVNKVPPTPHSHQTAGSQERNQTVNGPVGKDIVNKQPVSNTGTQSTNIDDSSAVSNDSILPDKQEHPEGGSNNSDTLRVQSDRIHHKNTNGLLARLSLIIVLIVIFLFIYFSIQEHILFMKNN